MIGFLSFAIYLFLAFVIASRHEGILFLALVTAFVAMLLVTVGFLSPLLRGWCPVEQMLYSHTVRSHTEEWMSVKINVHVSTGMLPVSQQCFSDRKEMQANLGFFVLFYMVNWKKSHIDYLYISVLVSTNSSWINLTLLYKILQIPYLNTVFGHLLSGTGQKSVFTGFILLVLCRFVIVHITQSNFIHPANKNIDKCRFKVKLRWDLIELN